MAEEEKNDWERLIASNKRPRFGYHFFQDKQYAERSIAKVALLAAGFDLGDDLHSISNDPPDCGATVDGVLCGIEVSELLHQRALKTSISAGAEHYFWWERDDLLVKIQEIIDRKDRPKFKVPRCYKRYYLVIHTVEMMLTRDLVTEYLKDATFHAEFITDVLFLLPYHPNPEGVGSYPVVTLTLEVGRNFPAGVAPI